MDSMRKNGYLVPSILLTEPGICFTCGKMGDCAVHEVYFGANRSISKSNGFYAWLCPNCHRIVHEKPDDGRMDRWLKKKTFLAYLELGHSREDFRAMIGRCYDYD